MTREEFINNTNWKMSYEEYQACDCTQCEKTSCIHRDTYRRVPRIDGGLGLCPNLAALYHDCLFADVKGEQP